MAKPKLQKTRMTKKLKILFFTPFASFSGSEMLLWYLLRNLDKTKYEIIVYSNYNGELLNMFPNHIRIERSRLNSSKVWHWANKILMRFNLTSIEERQIMQLHNKIQPDYWFVNTLLMSNVTDIAIKHNIKYTIYIHELLSLYAEVSKKNLQSMITNAAFSIGCSNGVSKNLKILGSHTTFTLNGCVDVNKIKLTNGELIKNKINVPLTSFVVLMSGQRTKRKGFDIFIDTALRLKDKPYHFVWLGKSFETGYEYFLEQKINIHQLTNLTLATPSHADYYDYFNCADVCFLSSIEDPFPLVMIEAACLGKPILAFKSGGSEEFLNENTGHIMSDFSENTIDLALEQLYVKHKNNEWNIEKIKTNGQQYSIENQSEKFDHQLTEIAQSLKL